jgi:UDP-N-acetylglucosamine transferase subunit ALG13
MIFVTVGAYDLPFNRLVAGVDALYRSGVFKEEVFAQIGHSVAPESTLPHDRFLPSDRMDALADEARIIITQGGPGSIMLGLARGKIPIVVPRQKEYGEMVDDHQVLFAQKLADEKKILLVRDLAELGETYRCYEQRTAGFRASGRESADNAALFADKLEKLILQHRVARNRGRA